MTAEFRRPVAVTIGTLMTLSLLAAVPTAAQDASPSSAPTASAGECVEPEASAAPEVVSGDIMPENYRIELFDGVWQGIRDFYVDPDTNGLDWDAIGDEYAPLLFQTDDADAIYDLLSEMVALLDDPFTGFYAPQDLGDPATNDPTYGGIGALLDTSAAGADSDGLRILYVFEGGSAKDGGIAARDRIVGVDGDSCARIADIRGPEGTDVTLTIISPGEAARDVTLERRRINPAITPEASRLESDPSIGYLRLISLVGQETIDGVIQALTVFTRGDDAIEGLIIDLRAADQGAPGVVIEMLRPFVRGEVGEFHTRLENEIINIEPNDLADEYAGIPLVVLVDEGSEAEAEQLAAILQDQGRATIIGQQTSGQTHGANTVTFDDGSVLQIVNFGFQLPSGQNLEGQGVTPDIEIDEDWRDFSPATDPGLLAALEVIDAERASSADSASA